MKTRITIIFEGAKFDYELSASKETVLSELNNIETVNDFIDLIDIHGTYVRISPNKVPVMEITESEHNNE